MLVQARWKQVAFGLAALAAGSWLAGCAAAVQPKATVDTSLEQELGPYAGPKASIAVSKFSWRAQGPNEGPRRVRKVSFFGQLVTYEESVEHAAEADGLKDMLTTALVQTKRYRVMERGELGVVTAEQELGASGLVEEETAAKRGAVKGADIVVVAAVTAWEPGTQKTEGAIGALFPKLGPLVAGGIGVKKSHLAIDIRIIDSSTSEILAATNVTGEASEFRAGAFGAGIIGALPLAGGLSGYARTPFEQAIRTCIKESIKYIVANTPASHYRY